jgi:hypothetical protein
VLLVTMVYGPIAAMLVELFPSRIRYTSMSLPYHIGNGWFGGFLPATAFAMVAATGDIYYGLWYPIVTLLVGLFLRRRRAPPLGARLLGKCVLADRDRRRQRIARDRARRGAAGRGL